MKKTSLIFNIVLAIAVAVLYVLHFSSTSTGKTSIGKTSLADSLAQPQGGIVYINIDSVLANYEMYKDIMSDLDSKLKTKDAELKSKQRSFEKSVADYQNKVQKGLVTRTEAAQIEQGLQGEQQSLVQLQQQMQYELAEEEQVAQRKVLNSIMEYLETLESDQQYQFVLGTTFGGNILYANDNLNITEDVIKGINVDYGENEK